MKNKKLKIGTYSLILSALVIAVIVVLNLLAACIPSRYTRYETTGYDIYDISDETINIISGIDREVGIYLISQRGNEDSVLNEFLSRYSQFNSNIDYKTVDPVVHPTVVTLSGVETDISEFSDNTVIVSSQLRDKTVDFNEIYTFSEEEQLLYEYYGIEPTTVYFSGEEVITGAVDYVNTGTFPTLYYLYGHGEAQVSNDILPYIELDNYESADLSLITDGTVPSNAGCILMNLPETDISDDELVVLKEYVDNGGRFILVSDLSSESDGFENLKALAAYYGMNAIKGRVVEGDDSMYNAENNYIYPVLSYESVITSQLTGYKIGFTPSSAFTVNSSSPSGADVTPLLTTSSLAYTLSSTALENTENEKLYEGECVIGAIANMPSNGYNNSGCFVWYSSPSVTDETAYSSGAGSLLLTTLTDLCDKDTSVSIASKALSSELLVIDESSVNFWSTLLTAVLPLSLLIIGFGVWYVRRGK